MYLIIAKGPRKSTRSRSTREKARRKAKNRRRRNRIFQRV